MIRVSFVWRRILAPYCRYLATGHQPYVEHLGALVHTRATSGDQISSITQTRSDPDFFYCPRCYAGWPGPAVRIERA